MKNIDKLIKEILHKELYKSLLLEDNRTKQVKKHCLFIIKNYYGINDANEKENQWAHRVFSGDDNPKNLTFLEQKVDKFLNDFFHGPKIRASRVFRLAPMFFRLALDAGYGTDAPDYDIINRLQVIIKFMYYKVLTENIPTDNIDIYNTTFEDLNRTWGSELDQLNTEDRKTIDDTQYEINNDYEIIGPIDYETANEYGNYSCPNSKLCYTQDEGTWGSWTQNGRRTCYIILKKGWENIVPEHDDESENAYDTYGLSMIFVFVSPEGKLEKSNTRWNHEANYNLENLDCDEAFNEDMITDLIGAPFRAIFKFNKGYNTQFNKVQEYLDNGEFNKFLTYNFTKDLRIIEYSDKYNIIDSNNKLLYPRLWFDEASRFYSGFIGVQKNEKSNLIKPDGTLLWNYPVEYWFDYVGDFYNGLAVVEHNHKWNFIKKNGKFLWKPKNPFNTEEWFDEIYIFHNGFARVKKNNKWNFLKPNGALLWKLKNPDEWFDDIHRFIGNFAVVQKNNKWNFLKPDGTLLWDYPVEEWFDSAYDFNNGLGVVKKNNKWNILKPDGTFLLNPENPFNTEEWFNDVDIFHNGFAIVQKNNKWNFLKPDGTLLWKPESLYKIDEWFDKAWKFYNGFAMVEKEGKYNYLKSDGTLLWRPENSDNTDEWFDKVSSFYNRFSIVRKNGKCNYLKSDGTLVWRPENPDDTDKWFDSAWNFFDGEIAKVKKNGKTNFLKSNGKLLWKPENPDNTDEWFDSEWDFENGFVNVRLDNKFYLLNKNGKLCDEKGNPIETEYATSQISENKINFTINDIEYIINEILKRI